MTRLILPALLLAAAAAASLLGNGYDVYVLGLVGTTAIVGVGLNILMGLSGQISIGHIGFFAIGSYATAILTTKLGLDFWTALVAACAIAGAVGGVLALPALRVSGPYLAMITIAFAFVVEHGAVEWREITGGANGIMGIPPPRLFGTALNAQGICLVIVLATALSLWFFQRFSDSRWGIALRAVRDSETAAASIGLDPLRLKAAAFAISAAFAGLAGGLFTPLAGFVSPETFPLIQSIIFVLVVMLGGAGTVYGPLLGAAIVVVLPESLSALAEYRLLFVGLLLLIVLWLAPNGLVGLLQSFRKQRAMESPHTKAPVSIEALIRVTADRPGFVADNLAITFGGLRAVNDVSFTAEPGRITSIIGPNGAGKTTVLNLATGFYRPESGDIRVNDTPITNWPAWRIARAGVARTYQTTQLFARLSVLDNMLIALSRGVLGAPLKTAAAADQGALAEGLLRFAGYRGALDLAAGDLAHIDRRIVEIARALATRPRVLFLDEPAAGLGPDDTRLLGALLQRLAALGLAIVVVEHDMDLVMSISHHIVVLDAGRSIAAGAPAQMRADPAVRKAYLGDGSFAARGRAAPWDGVKDSILNVVGLTAGYGAAPVLRDVSLTLHSGEMVALLGANGAGKSTMMAAISGLHRPVDGAIEFTGVSCQDAGAHLLVAAGLVLVPEGRQVFPELSVADNIRLGAFSRRDFDPATELPALIARFPRLGERWDQRAGLLSGGEQQMLALARGLVAKPRVLLLDEPSLGLAPQLVEQLYADLARLRDDGFTILLVDQMANLALGVADRAYVLRTGAIVHHGSAAALRHDDALLRAYLGDETSKPHKETMS